MTEFDLLRRDCLEQRTDLSEHLAAGGARSYEEYCKSVGAIGALDRVIAKIEELEKKFVED